MTIAVRIQRKRTKGWRMPPGAVYVGRPTLWGNPYRVGAMATELGWLTDAEGAVWKVERKGGEHRVTLARSLRLYRELLDGSHSWVRSELRGKSLACWCPLDRECHADILLEIANQ